MAMSVDTAKLRLSRWLEARVGLPDSTVLNNYYTFAELGLNLGDVREIADEIDRLRKQLDWIISTGMWCLKENSSNLWSVFVPGDQGEPNWKEIARGKTPREAIDAAIAAQPKEKE